MTVRGRLAQSWRVKALVLLAAFVVLAGVFALVGLALGEHTSHAELRFMRHVDQGPSAVLTTIAKVLSTIGSQVVLLPVSIIVTVTLIWRRELAGAAITIIAVVGALGLYPLVKVLVDRPRPRLEHLVHVGASSFPSGHATQAAAILPALALAAAALGARRHLVLTIAAITAVGIGASRVLLGVHYPTDVVAGWALGAGWLMTVRLVIGMPTGGRETPSAPDDAQ